MARLAKAKPDQRRRPKQARSQATVEALLDAATRILRQQGPEALTTNAVAERAGVGIGSLYEYFPSKQAILVALARRLLADDQAALRDALDQPTKDLTARLLEILIRRHGEDIAVRRAVMAVHLSQGLGREHLDGVHVITDRLAGETRRLTGRGEPLSPLELFVVTRAALGIARATADEGGVPWPTIDSAHEVARMIGAYLSLPPTARVP